MGQDIRSAPWMSPATKDQALTKLQQVSNKIGYPEKWKDYSTVQIARAITSATPCAPISSKFSGIWRSWGNLWTKRSGA